MPPEKSGVRGLYLFALFGLAGCGGLLEETIICGDGPQQCCRLVARADPSSTGRSFCVPNCSQCASTSTENATCPEKSVNVNQGCHTGTRRRASGDMPAMSIGSLDSGRPSPADDTASNPGEPAAGAGVVEVAAADLSTEGPEPSGVQIAQAGPPTAAPFMCEAVCDPAKTTPYCTTFTPGDRYRAGLEGLFQVSYDQNATEFPPEALRSLFGVADDPCARSATTIREGRIANTGAACAVTAQGGVPGAPLTVTLSVPALLSARYERGADRQVAVFDNAQNALKLEFSDAALQSDLGGILTRVIAERRRYVWQTTNGCIAVNTR